MPNRGDPRCGSPVARRQQPTARGSAWLMRGNRAPESIRLCRPGPELSRPDRNHAQQRNGDSLEATTNSGRHRGHGGHGGSHGLRDGGDVFDNGSFETGPAARVRPSAAGSHHRRLGGHLGTSTTIDNYWQPADGTKSIDLNGFPGRDQPDLRDDGQRHVRRPVLAVRQPGHARAVPERRRQPAIKTLTVHATGGPTTSYSFDTATTGNTFADMSGRLRPTRSRRRAPRPRCTFTSTTRRRLRPRHRQRHHHRDPRDRRRLQEGRLADHGRQRRRPRSRTRATASATTRPARRTSPSSR